MLIYFRQAVAMGGYSLIGPLRSLCC